MNTIDIIALLIVAFAAYKGFVNGLVVELCHLLSIFVGGYAAYYFSSTIASMLPIPKEYSEITAFALVLITAVVLIAILSRLISKLLSITPLGVVNSLLGAVISIFKSSVVISLVIFSVLYVNSFTKWIPNSVFKESITCQYANKINSTLFPYIEYFEDYYKKFKSILPKNEGISSKGDWELV